MNCDRCGKRPATVRYTEYADGEPKKMRICAECADEIGFGPPETETAKPPSPVAPAASVMGLISVKETVGGLAPPPPLVPDDDRVCPGCGLSAADLNKDARFGCEQCYETFAESLEPLFERLHGATRHAGRLPGGAQADPDPPDEAEESP